MPSLKGTTVRVENIDKFHVSISKGSAKVSFEVTTVSEELLKLIFLHVEGKPLNLTFESPECEYALKITQFNINDGSIRGDIKQEDLGQHG